MSKSNEENDPYRKLPDAVLAHKTIMDFWADDSEYILTYAARRSYKTVIVLRRLVKYIMTHSNKRVLIGTSTLSQTSDLYFDRLRTMIPRKLIKSITKMPMRIQLINGTRIDMFSAENADRLQGGDYPSMFIMDECGAFDLHEVWNNHLLPIVKDPGNPGRCQCFFMGVPRTDVSMAWKDFIIKHSDSRKFPNWSVYTWSSEDVLTPEEIADNKAESDTLHYEVNFRGQFADDISGKCYYNFDENRHISDTIVFDRNRPVAIAMDFNVGIMSPQFIQHNPQTKLVTIATELTARNTNVFDIGPKIKDKLIELYGSEQFARSTRITFYGDAAGFAQTANSRGAAWDELRDQFKGWNVSFDKIPRSNPSVDSRISAMNTRLKSADGNIHMLIHPSCEEFIKDLKNVSRDDLEKNKDKQKERTHSSDAVGYFVAKEYPMRSSTMYNA